MGLYSAGGIINQTVTWTTISNIAWTGTPPSAAFGAEYNLNRVGTLVVINLAVAYDTVGASNTEILIPWQAGWPAISKPSWATGALAVYGGGYHLLSSIGDVVPTTFTGVNYHLRRNAANDGDEYRAAFTSSGRSGFYGTFSYQAT